MSRPQDIFGASSPKTALNKPMFHVQDQKAYNVAGGTSIADAWTKRDLNTVILNQIPGASLGANSVNLPAGTYYVEGMETQRWEGSIVSAIAAIFVGSSKVLQGMTQVLYAPTPIVVYVSGVITLSTSQTIELRYYAGVAGPTDSLGFSNSTGSITDASIPSIYADLKIWQLDTTIQTPVLVSDKLFPLPGNCMVTGNMHGLEYVRNGANQISIYPGICMDSLNTTMLTLSNQQNLTLPASPNSIFNLFLCDDGVVRYDTDVNGANLTTYKIRWFGYVRNNAAGALCDFTFFPQSNTMVFNLKSETADVTGFTSTTFVLLTPFTIPVTRVCGLRIYPHPSTTTTVWYSLNGSSPYYNPYYSTASGDTNMAALTGVYSQDMMPYNGTLYVKLDIGYSTTFFIHKVQLRR